MSDHFFTLAGYGIYSKSTGCFDFTCLTRVLLNALPRLNSKVLQLSKSLSLASVHHQLVWRIVMQWHVANRNPSHCDANEKRPGRHVRLHRLKWGYWLHHWYQTIASCLHHSSFEVTVTSKTVLLWCCKDCEGLLLCHNLSHSFAAAPGHH